MVFVRKIKIGNKDIFVTCHRKIDHIKFDKICQLILQFGNNLLHLEKSSVILIQGNEEYYVVERMNTDTYTIHVHYVIYKQKVYKLTENQTIS